MAIVKEKKRINVAVRLFSTSNVAFSLFHMISYGSLGITLCNITSRPEFDGFVDVI